MGGLRIMPRYGVKKKNQFGLRSVPVMNTVYLTASEHVLPAQPLYAENAGQVGGEVGREHQDVVHEYVVPEKRERKKLNGG